MQKTLNLTQHVASQAQLKAGVLDLPESIQQQVKDLLTFHAVPTAEEIRQRAEQLAYEAASHVWELAEQEAKKLAPYFWGEDEGLAPSPAQCKGEFSRVMIGGAPYLMGPLAEALREHGLEPVFAFTERVSVDEPQADGSVRKVAVFRHSGWVPAL